MSAKRWGIVRAITVTIDLVAAPYFAFSSVLIRFKDAAAVDPGDGLHVVFNPLRNRKPELVATSFLDLLQKDQCQEVKKVLKKIEYVASICEREAEHRLISWELANREDKSDQTFLHFKVKRTGYSDSIYGNVWVTVKKQNEKWLIENYEAWY